MVNAAFTQCADGDLSQADLSHMLDELPYTLLSSPISSKAEDECYEEFRTEVMSADEYIAKFFDKDDL